MKKLLFVFTLMLGAAFTSCGNATSNVSEADSIDSISVDTVDSVVVDSVVAE